MSPVPTVTYGLSPTVWRLLRQKHSGCGDVDLYDRDGRHLGVGFLFRYDERGLLRGE